MRLRKRWALRLCVFARNINKVRISLSPSVPSSSFFNHGDHGAHGFVSLCSTLYALRFTLTSHLFFATKAQRHKVTTGYKLRFPHHNGLILSLSIISLRTLNLAPFRGTAARLHKQNSIRRGGRGLSCTPLKIINFTFLFL